MAIKKFLKDVERLREEHRERHMPRPKAQDQHDESNWLVSYADMMTLLCGFFIMLFSLSKIDEPKYEVLKQSVAQHFGGIYKSPTADLSKTVSQIIDETGLKSQTVIKPDAYGVAVEFESTLFFDTLSADIRPQGKVVLDRLIQKLAEKQIHELKEFPITIEGHTDSRPILSGGYASNWELSGARAARVARLFIEHGFSPAKLAAIGFSDSRPVQVSRTPAGAWDESALSKNRRVVIRIFRPDYEPLPFMIPPASSAH